MPQTLIVFSSARSSLAAFRCSRLLLQGGGARGGVAGALTVPFLMLVLAAFLTAFYMFRVVFIAFFGRRRTPHGEAGHHATTRPPHDGAPVDPRRAPMTLGIGFAVRASARRSSRRPAGSPPRCASRSAGIALAWLIYQRRVVDAPSRGRVRRHRDARARRGSGSTTSSRWIYRGCVSASRGSSGGSTATSWTASSTC
jgi:hypothetical protein